MELNFVIQDAQNIKHMLELLDHCVPTLQRCRYVFDAYEYRHMCELNRWKNAGKALVRGFFKYGKSFFLPALGTYLTRPAAAASRTLYDDVPLRCGPS
ncbi:hypothetical protein U1Q18_045299, partial [Sarracenia purpurea var. burkii]